METLGKNDELALEPEPAQPDITPVAATTPTSKRIKTRDLRFIFCSYIK